MTSVSPVATPISTASGPFPVNEQLAQQYAQVALANIDWSKPDIYIWVPGTDCRTVNSAFAVAVNQAYQGAVSCSVLDYNATWDMRPSVATGIEALRLVLQGVAQHGLHGHHLFLGGESQGAWVIGEVMANPDMEKLVTRAVIMGHPSLAYHQYTDGHDPKVYEDDHKDDMISAPVHGDQGKALDAMTDIHLGTWMHHLPQVLGALAHNSFQAKQMLLGFFRWIHVDKSIDPHDYEPDMPSLEHWLQTGSH